ncbi:hypothetical protein TomMM35A_19790 [Sphingobium sp. TomMM35A]
MSAKFLQSFGFQESPFSSTNADTEPNLAQYFVSPPYFSSVKGDPSDPKSNVILAPRGGGKTAQKVMLEEHAETTQSNPVYCITYDNFRRLPKAGVRSVSLDWHLTQIIQRMLTGIASLIDEGHGENLSSSDKRVLSYCFSQFLGSLTAADAQQAFASVKSMPEKAADFLKKHGHNMMAFVMAVAARWGVGKPEFRQIESELREEPLSYIFERLISIVRGFGFSAVYILVDRVDEIPQLLNDAESAFKFIEPLISDLYLLETKDCAFKLFLWDQIDAYLGASSFRGDRIPVYTLNWSQAELEDMLSKRLKAYSNGRVASLNNLKDSTVDWDLHKMACALGKGSPRDVIRLVGRIVDEHTRVEDSVGPINKVSVERGISKFSRERSRELYGNRIDDLLKIGLPSFTIGELANDIFRISHQAARNKIQNFLNVGAVVKSGELENPGNRPLHQYSLSDVRLAVVCMSGHDFQDIIEGHAHVCPKCTHLMIREQGEASCDECGHIFDAGEVTSLHQHCV